MGSENIAIDGVEFKDKAGVSHKFKLGVKAQAWLARKHGTTSRVYRKMSGEIDEDCNPIIKNKDEDQKTDLTICQLDALVDIVYAGLKRDYEEKKLVFELDDAINIIDDLGYKMFFGLISGNMKDALPDADKADPTSGQT